MKALKIMYEKLLRVFKKRTKEIPGQQFIANISATNIALEKPCRFLNSYRVCLDFRRLFLAFEWCLCVVLCLCKLPDCYLRF